MKKALLMTMALVLIAIPATVQADYLGLFSDQLGQDCAAFDTTPGLVTVYVVHMEADNGGTGAQFMIDYSGAPTLDNIGESYLGIPIGNTTGGISLGYGDCYQSPIVITTISLFGQGLSDPCSILRIVPDPNNIVPNEIQVTDCDLNLLNVEGRGLLINPDASCPDCVEIPVATDIDSWGSLKSLYR